MVQAWRYPALWTCPIEKPWFPVARVALPSAASAGRATEQRIPNGLPAVGEFGCEHDAICSFLHNRNAGCRAASRSFRVWSWVTDSVASRSFRMIVNG